MQRGLKVRGVSESGRQQEQLSPPILRNTNSQESRCVPRRPPPSPSHPRYNTYLQGSHAVRCPPTQTPWCRPLRHTQRGSRAC